MSTLISVLPATAVCGLDMALMQDRILAQSQNVRDIIACMGNM